MNPIATILANQPVMILDGALATELERRGCDLHDPLWSARVLIEAPELIRAVHADYYAAGADCSTTASYQATFAGFARRGLDHAASAQLMRLAVQLAAEARDSFWATANQHKRPRPLVAASIGPYGAFLADGSEYRGNYAISEAELIDFHRPRMAELLAAGADLLACETIPCLAEACAILKLLKEFPNAYAWISFSASDHTHTCQGELFADCAAEIGANPQIVAVGINCTAPEYIPSLVAAAHHVTNTPIVVYPNSGEQYNPVSGNWSGQQSCTDFGLQAQEWYANGARIIGGCCRTTPDHIREIAQWVDSLPRNAR